MKQSILTQSEVAQKVMQMFPSLSRFDSDGTCIYNEDGNSILKVSEFKSGISRVRSYPFMNKSYSQLKREDKIKVTDFINSLKVDLIEEQDEDGRIWKNYFLAGVYPKYHQTRYIKTVSSYKVIPFNY